VVIPQVTDHDDPPGKNFNPTDVMISPLDDTAPSNNNPAEDPLSRRAFMRRAGAASVGVLAAASQQADATTTPVGSYIEGEEWRIRPASP